MSFKEFWHRFWTQGSPGSNFDKTPTPGIVTIEVLILGLSCYALCFLQKFTNKIFLRAGIIAAGIFIFEMFTSPMWLNAHMGWWAYLYQDISWILTIGWTALILTVVTLVDHRFQKMSGWKRFGLYLSVLTPVVFLLQMLMVNVGIRTYSPEVQQTISGIKIAGAPIEALYYVPVFMSLVIGFYKFWSLSVARIPVVPPGRLPWLRTLGLPALGVLLFELMIEPMVHNENFPSWSYVYHDITFLMTGLWIAVVWISILLVERFLPHWSLVQRFMLYLLVTAAIATPVEAWFIDHGYRVYGPSCQAIYSGIRIPGTQVPVEVAFAIPLYFALVIGFVRYGEFLCQKRMTPA